MWLMNKRLATELPFRQNLNFSYWPKAAKCKPKLTRNSRAEACTLCFSWNNIKVAYT